MPVKTVQKTKKIQAKARKEISLPLEKENFVIITIGIIFLIVGYIFMSENSVDGFLPTIAAPILLVLGYCVIIPYGIIKKSSKTKKIENSPEIGQVIAEPKSGQNVSSNIKTN